MDPLFPVPMPFGHRAVDPRRPAIHSAVLLAHKHMEILQLSAMQPAGTGDGFGVQAEFGTELHLANVRCLFLMM